MATDQGDRDFLRNWEAVRADGSIQFTPLEQPKAPDPPDWLQRLLEWLGEVLQPVARALDSVFRLVGLSWDVGKWILLALAVAALGWLVWTNLRPTLKRKAEAPTTEAVWQPERGAALGLLEDADRLAQAGDFAGATHLLLQRSVAQIDAARPGLLHPSSTAREISTLPALPATARTAFGTIAARVERSLFALRALDAGDWQAARAAYAEFALGPLGHAAA
ncbi:hypothetical protein [Tsuneonella sp. HG222]